MPIYELYCGDCDTLFNFFSAAVDTEARPLCPRCGAVRLERRPARFAIGSSASGGGGEEADELGELGVDEERLGSAFETALAELESSGADPDDPRQLARVLRRVGETAGLEPGPEMDEMLRRLEAGEDPEALEDDLGDAFDEGGDDEGADPLVDLFRRKRAGGRRRRKRPKVDDELYFL